MANETLFTRLEHNTRSLDEVDAEVAATGVAAECARSWTVHVHQKHLEQSVPFELDSKYRDESNVQYMSCTEVHRPRVADIIACMKCDVFPKCGVSHRE